MQCRYPERFAGAGFGGFPSPSETTCDGWKMSERVNRFKAIDRHGRYFGCK